MNPAPDDRATGRRDGWHRAAGRDQMAEIMAIPLASFGGMGRWSPDPSRWFLHIV